MHRSLIPVVLFLAVGTVRAEPRIAPGGVYHAAGRAPAGLPGSSIARGSLITILGSDLGPAEGVTLHGPAQTDLADVSVAVLDSAGAVHAASPVFVQSSQVDALLPCGVALGNTRIIVRFNGRSSQPSAAVQTVRQNFQVFTRNREGWGPAVAQNLLDDGPTFNTVLTPAGPGAVVALWGTGLASCEDGDHPEDVQVLIGSTAALLLGHQSLPGHPGVEQMLVLVPVDAPQGCYVPVVVRAGHQYSNFASLSIAPPGEACSDLFNGFTSMIPRLKDAPLSWARIQLLQGGAVTERPGILTLRTSSEYGEASFIRSSLQDADYGFHYPAPGACLVMPYGSGTPVSSAAGTILHAGDLTLVGPWSLSFFLDSLDGTYRRRLSPTPFEGRSGNYIRPNTRYTVIGHGGLQVGPFQASMIIPNFLEWTNRDHLPFVLHRSAPVVLTWSGSDPSKEFVAIRGFSWDRQLALGRDFVCTARIGAQGFRLPESVLSLLPAATVDMFISVGNLPLLLKPAFHAHGIDMGFFSYEITSGRNFALQ